MKIKNHRLLQDDDSPFSFIRSPNGGGKLNSQYLIIHYTAGSSAESTIEWLTNPAAKASVHLVIGKNGEITQLMPFDTIAWHAGQSSWNGLGGMNKYSIGIELDNAGKMIRENNKWVSWFGTTYPDEEVLVAKHKNATEEAGWYIFTPQQLEACIDVSSLLIQKYGIKDVLGHDDISPFRKEDPGPAFPMSSVRSKVLGRREDEPEIYQTTVTLNIREGAGTNFASLPEGPLPEGTKVEILRVNQLWRFVDVLDTVNGSNDLQGWVHGSFLRNVET